MEQENTTNTSASGNNEAESSIFESSFGGFIGQGTEPASSDQKDAQPAGANDGVAKDGESGDITS